jgi:ubiquinone/menaquinone biosynthesis C-methylase UbiE
MPHGHDVDRFDQMAKTYDRHWLQHFVFEPVQRTVLDLAQQSVKEPAAVLDVGCGTGRLLRSAEQRFPNAALEGVDAAPGMVTQAHASISNGSRIHFQQAVAEQLPFPDGRFDLVFSTLTFHHWQDQEQGIREVARVLTPRGRWVVADLVPTGVIGSVLRLFRMHQFPERARFQTMLASAGLLLIGDRRVPGLGGQLDAVLVGRSR